MRLRAIPPNTAMKRLPRQRALRLGHADHGVAWQPHIHQKARKTPSLLSLRALAIEVQRNIDRLTEEIAEWLPEFGEEALLKLYEERARWAEGTM